MPANAVVVTGADGFLGRQVVHALSLQNIDVVKATRKNGFDVCSLQSMEQLPPFTMLVHLAAQTFVPSSYTNTAAFFHTNIIGTLNALEICKKNKSHFVFASSYVYGVPQQLPVSESHPLSNWNPYATSKIIGEQLCASYHKEFNVPVSILRIFNIYGNGQHPDFLIPKIIKGVMQGQLELESDYPKRDFVHVADVADALVKCVIANKEGINTYNVGSGKSYSVKEVVEAVQTITGKKITPVYRNIQRSNEVTNVIADCTKIKTELNWSPKFDLYRGLVDVIQRND